MHPDFETQVDTQEELLEDFRKGLGQGYAWQGVLFCKNRALLGIVEDKAARIFLGGALGGSYNRQRGLWTFPGGEKLFLRQISRPEDYWSYHGCEYQWIGWFERASWKDDGIPAQMTTILRNIGDKSIPIRVVSCG